MLWQGGLDDSYFEGILWVGLCSSSIIVAQRGIVSLSISIIYLEVGWTQFHGEDWVELLWKWKEIWEELRHFIVRTAQNVVDFPIVQNR